MISLLQTYLLASDDAFEAVKNYLSTRLKTENSALPVKSVLIHPQNRAKVLGRANYFRPELPESYFSHGGHFKIHYTTAGSDAVNPFSSNPDSVPDFVYQAGQIAERCYSLLIDTLGLEAPPADNYDGNQIDIYIKNWGGNPYAETYPEAEVTTTSRPYDYTAYTIIDNDYSEYPTRGLAGLQVTIAHELFHVVQLGYNWWPNNGLSGSSNGDAYFLEWSSTWFEEYAYPEVNDYWFYLSYFFSNPTMSLWSDSYSYALGPFLNFIVRQADSAFIKRVWERIKSQYALEALEAETSQLLQRDLPELWNIFCRKCYYTNIRYDERYALSEDARNFPLLNIPAANRVEFLTDVALQASSACYSTQPYLVAAKSNLWLALSVQLIDASPGFGSYILRNSAGDFHQDIIWSSSNLIGKFSNGDNLFIVLTNGNKRQNGTLNVKLTRVADTLALTTEIKHLYPNPVYLNLNQDLHVFLQTGRLMQRAVLMLYDLVGRRVYAEIIPTEPWGIGLHEIVLPSAALTQARLSAGMYLLAIDCGHKTVSRRVIILK